MRGYVGDDDLFFAALRALTVPYDGPAITLWRGQPKSDPVGMSWTRSVDIAMKFALYGLENVYPHRMRTAPFPPREDGVLMRVVAHREIICAPCLLGKKEGAFILDPAISGRPLRTLR